jgi:phasin
MYDKPGYEIPEAMRQMAEQNVDQARTAYNQFLDIVRKAQEMMTQSSGAMTKSAMEIQTQVMRYTQANIEAGFQFAAELARARDAKEYVEIQTRHAQRQMQTYAQQAQDIGRLMAEAAQKVQPRP